MKKWILALLAVLLAWNVWLTVTINSTSDEEVIPSRVTRYSVTGYTSNISEIAGNVSSSLVQIQSRETGSGFIYDAEDDNIYIITNSDLIDNSNITVTFDSGLQTSAELVGYDEGTKVAVLRVVYDLQVTLLSKATLSQLVPGAYVIGLEARSMENNLLPVSYGVTSGVGQARISTRSMYYAQILETDCRMTDQLKGSVLTDAGGALLGMFVEGVISGADNKSYVVGVNDIQNVYSDIVSDGVVSRGCLSIETINVADLYAYQKNERGLTMDLSSGILVNAVNGNARDILQVGDVITAIDEESISNAMQLREKYYDYTSGDQVSVSIIRNGEEMNVSVILE